MHKILLALLLSFPVHAALNDVDKAQVLHQNMLSNPGFENGLVGWTASGGAVVLITSGSNLLKGKRSVTWDASAAAQTYCSALVPVEEGDKGENGLSMIKIKTPSGTATHTLFANDGSNPVGPAVTVTSDANGVITQVNFIYPTSGSVQLCIEAQADEPLIAIDLGYQGFAANITSVTPNSTAQSYTPDLVGFGTETSVNFTWSQDGIYMDVTGEFTSGTSEAIEAQLPLPDGYTIASQVSGISNAGVYVRGVVASGHGGVILMTAGDAFVNFSHSETFGSTSVNAAIAVNGNAAHGNAQRMIINFRVPIAEFAASVSVFKADQTNRPWVDETLVVTAFGTATSDELMCRRQGQNLECNGYFTSGTIPATTIGSISLPDGLTIDTSIITRGNTSSAEGQIIGHYGGVGTNIVGYLLSATATDAGEIYFGDNSSGTQNILPVNSDAIFSNNVKIHFKFSVPIEGWNETMNAPHVKFAVVTSDNISVQALESALIEYSAGTPSVTNQSGDWISSIVDNATGDFTVNINTGIFSVTPICTCTVQRGDGSDCTVDDTTTPSPTVIRFQLTNEGGGDVDGPAHIHCHGPR